MCGVPRVIREVIHSLARRWTAVDDLLYKGRIREVT
jgi:hypothetical protein